MLWDPARDHVFTTTLTKLPQIDIQCIGDFTRPDTRGSNSHKYPLACG
jgi:hypothetical protein